MSSDFQSKSYCLKNGEIVSTIPKGSCRFKEGTVNEAGYLTLIGRVPSKKGIPKVLCLCKCGNYTVLTHQAFKSGTTKSCGCYNLKQKQKLCANIGHNYSTKQDYSTDNTNPFYKFLSSTNELKNRSIVWNIQCKKCGKIFQEIPAYLVSNTRARGNNPCDCWKNISKGVLKIKQILDSNNISYVQEFSFSSCVSPKGNLMKFDFYINNQYLIEYDGEQHFFPISFYGSDRDDIEQKFQCQQQYDKIKDTFCKKYNIPLIRIPYTRYNNLCLEDLTLKTSKFIVKGEIKDKR